AVLETSKGIIKLRPFPEQTPLAYENFTGLIKEGYYDGITFHRVMNEFMIQGGDPEGTGRGGESIWGEDFAIESGRNLYNIRGALCMANTGEPNSNSSQFYIVQRKPDGTTAADLIAQGWPEWAANIYETSGGAAWLDKEYGQAEYTVFGQVISGMEVVDAIAAVATDDNDKPLEDVIIVKAYMDTYTAAQ
ncbi:MAG: peptidylprolyl isomerase, partial [Clostridia bacterium]|nr:peptidylprolyl isomerase [Clostridia bacterium]